jgi:hypothetical protein
VSPSFPFIVGCGRSGTTLVRAILNAHPEMAVPGESYFVVWLGRQRRRYEVAGGFDQGSFLDDLSGQAWFRRWGLPDDVVRVALADAAPAGFPDAVRALYRAYARQHGKQRYGDKTPIYVLHLPLIASLLPEAAFVHVLRDGRNVALSLLDAGWGPQRWEHAALHWRLQVERGRAAGQVLGANRYYELRYEDLLDDAEGEARTLCRFLDLQFDASMLRYFEGAASLLSAEPYPHEHENLRLPPTKGLRDWRTAVPAREVIQFEALAGDLLTDLGYPRAVPNLPLPARMRAYQVQARWNLGRAARQAKSKAARAAGR